MIDLLGTGGMGDVYRARDGRLQRDVALKVLREPEAASGRLLREARAASALNHSSICHVYDVGESEHRGWIAMEYVPGERLDRRIPAMGLPPETVVHVGAQIADALAHAHAHGIVHRDLKTANCVWRPDGQVKVLDFGLAVWSPDRVQQEMTQSAAGGSTGLAGTPSYMAPEILRGEPADEQSDLWALGVVLYELASGARPYSASTGYALASSILTDPPKPLPPSLPDPLRFIIMRLLEKDRGRRYRTADEVRVALETVRAGTPHEKPTTRKLAARRWAAAVAAGLVVGAAVGMWWLGRDRSLQLSNTELLSTFDGSHDAPAFSPSGELVAFVAADANRVPQVWVKNLAEGPPIQITSGPAAAERPRWHPSGNAIVFGRRNQGIWSIPALGGTPTRIVERGANPNFSRNGARMTWETQDGIWVAAADGSDAHAVEGVPARFYSMPRFPALSPDGSTIAFFQAAIGPNGDLWTIPVAGGQADRLTHDVREGSVPVWNADGTRIIYSSARAGSRTLWHVGAEGGDPEPLTTGAGEDDAPDLSSDGSRLVFTNTRNAWRLIVAPPSGPDRTLLERRSEILFPAFSPDGSRIAFFGRAERAVAIYTIAPDGSDLRQLTGGVELNHQPRWSHDGRTSTSTRRCPRKGCVACPRLAGRARRCGPGNGNPARACSSTRPDAGWSTRARRLPDNRLNPKPPSFMRSQPAPSGSCRSLIRTTHASRTMGDGWRDRGTTTRSLFARWTAASAG